MDYMVSVASLDQLAEFFLEEGGLLEAAVGVQIVPEKAVDGARNVGADGVEGFVFAAEAVRRRAVDGRDVHDSETISSSDEARTTGETRDASGQREFVALLESTAALFKT